MEELTITIEQGSHETTKITAKGCINTASALMLEEKLEETINDGVKNILINMLKVNYLSSSGIRVILKTYKQLEEMGGKFNIEMPSENVKNVLGMTALDQILLK